MVDCSNREDIYSSAKKVKFYIWLGLPHVRAGKDSGNDLVTMQSSRSFVTCPRLGSQLVADSELYNLELRLPDFSVFWNLPESLLKNKHPNGFFQWIKGWAQDSACLVPSTPTPYQSNSATGKFLDDVVNHGRVF